MVLDESIDGIHGQVVEGCVRVLRSARGLHCGCGLVDFGGARAAAPELDIGALFGLDLPAMAGLQKGFLDGYTEAGDLPPAFWERLAVYQAFAALEGLVRAHDLDDAEEASTCRSQIERVLDAGAAPLAP